jgi:hypothetical protein
MREAAGQGNLAINRHLPIEIAGPDAVRQVMHDMLEADRRPDGEQHQDNVFRYVVAARRRPVRC